MKMEERTLTFEEYVEIGKRCKSIEHALLEINEIVTVGLKLKPMEGITGKEVRSFLSEAFIIQKKMGMMRSAFDNNLAIDYPDLFSPNVFYGDDYQGA